MLVDHVIITITIQRGCNSAIIDAGAELPTELIYIIKEQDLIQIFDSYIITDPTDLACGSFIYSLEYLLNGVVQ